MKLVEILARELGEWPETTLYYTQDSIGTGIYSSFPFLDMPQQDGLVWNGDIDPSSYAGNVYSQLATDHATAIVTREMWQAERDKLAIIQVGIDAADSGRSLPLSEVKARYYGPLQWRDRIREIDIQLADLTLERAERVAELDAEGFALIDVAVVPVEDMSDWRTWRAGDMVEVVLENDDSLRVGAEYKVRAVEGCDYEGSMPVSVFIGDDDWCWPSDMSGEDRLIFKFHSRP